MARRSPSPKSAGTGNALREYSDKRAFDVTPEPGPQVAARTGPLLFVVQQHRATRLHYDFRLELDGVLKSWAVPKGPSLDPAEKRLAMPTEDHPFEYASFEGIIPPGQYGAGEVIVWDCGVWSEDDSGETWFGDRDQAEARARAALAKGKLSLELRGEKLKGSFALVRTSDGKSWLLIKHKDRFVSTDPVAARERSVLSGMTVAEMKAHPVSRLPAAKLIPGGAGEALPAKLLPMLADSRDAPFGDPRWAWEPKLDGYRVLAFVESGKVELKSRRGGLALTRAFPGLVAELEKQIDADVVLDGEIVALDARGRPSFTALQERVQLKADRDIAAAERKSPALLYCFDLLHFAGMNLREAPYVERRRWLAQCLLPTPHVQLMHVSDDGRALYEAALASGFEGVIAKRKDAKYEAGRRSSAWLKVKSTQSAEFVIGGFTKGKGAREPMGALLLGYWSGGKLHYAGHAGSGFDDRTLADVQARLDALRTTARPFAEKPDLHSPTTWVKPELVAEVKFHEWTKDDMLRAPVFLRLRGDVDPRTVGRVQSTGAVPERNRPRPTPRRSGEEGAEIGEVLAQLENTKATHTISVGPHSIRLTHLDRVYWPEDRALKQPALTKRDLLRYLAQVSPHMIRHLRDRPLTMIRMPEGIDGQRFYQKHWEQTIPDFVERTNIYSESKDERQDYLLVNNLPTLLWLAQSGTLEFHVWHSRVTRGDDAAVDGTDFSSSLEALENSLLNFPDYVVFDIDPYIYSGKEKKGEEPELNTVAFEKGKEIAFALRELLNGMKLEPIVKTSGKTGLHVFVPIRRTIDFDTARAVSELVGRHLMREHPKDITMEWSVPKRTGKIFMDYNMNVRGKTLNVAYSPRGLPGAAVSMPLTWEELEKAHPLDFRITNAAERLVKTGDRWAEALTRKQSLEKVLENAKS